MLVWSIVGAASIVPGSWVGRGLHKLWRWLAKSDRAVEATESVAKATTRGASGEELARRRAKGLAAEATRAKQIEDGGEFVLRGDRVHTPYGDRIEDIGVYEDPGKTILKRYEEVKSGKSWYGGDQKKKDDWIKEVLERDVVIFRAP
jgi:hypothetical protein